MAFIQPIFDAINALGGPIALLVAALAAGVGAIYFYGLLRPAQEYEGDSAVAVQARQDYAARRSNLADGRTFGEWYGGLLDQALDHVDRFFGDEPGPKRALSQYWSASALDRCLLLALIYPVLTLLVVWHLTGATGPVEAALRLPEVAEPWRRGLSAASIGGVVAAAFWSVSGVRAQVGGISGVIRFAVFAGAVAVAFAAAGEIAFAFAAAAALAIAAAFAFAGAIVFAFGVAVAFAAEGAFAAAGAAAGAVAGAGAGAVACAFAVDWAVRHRPSWGVAVLLVFCLTVLAASAGAAAWLDGGEARLLLLAFFGVLPVVNALFDWLSLGVTRALLRRGQRVGGALAPLGFALLDLAIAFVVLMALVAASTALITGLNSLAGETIFDIAALLNQLEDPVRRLEPNTWWVFVMVFTTLLPSLANITVAFLASGRALMGGLNRWVVDRCLPADPRALTPGRRLGASVALTAQWVVAALAATALIGVLAGLFFVVLEPLGLGLVDIAWWAHNLILTPPLTPS